jgi:hypothetical protein
MNKRWFIHTSQVETFERAGAYGDQFAAPVSHAGYLMGGIKLVRNQSGQEVVSSAQWLTDPANASFYTLDSRFTDPSGRVSRVVGVNVNQTPSGIADNVEVYLT